MSSDPRARECGRVWQARGGLTAAVLRAVFAWLGGAELARAGAACRAWRAAAAAPAHWRRLLRAPAPDRTYMRWREEFVRAHAGWELRARLAVAPAPLLHAALAPGGRRLALTTDDADLLIWVLGEDEQWREEWRRSLRARGWERVARAAWAAGGARLLLAGPRALAQRWELLVLQRDEEGGWSVASRAACGAGAGGCWAGAAGGAYLTLDPRRVAAHHFITTVWLNAATQETQSEYAGVTTPLLHIYNEEEAHITHVVVAEVPLHSDAIDEECDTTEDDDDSDEENVDLFQVECKAQVLVAGFGGACGAVRAWGLRALRPPPLLAAGAGELRERAAAARARRAAAAAPAPPAPPEPSEAAVRAMCTPPDAQCRLQGPLIGLVVQDDGRCVWACTVGAAMSSWSLPELRPLRQLPAPSAPSSETLHYVQPAHGRSYIVSLEGGLSGRVRLWAAASGAPAPALPHAAPALVAALPPVARAARATLLVLATDHLYRSAAGAATAIAPAASVRLRAATHTGMALRSALGTCARLQKRCVPPRREVASRSCEGGEAPPCPACPRVPPPPCRGVPAERARATRVVCCPPPQGRAPPCDPPCINPPLTCADSIRTRKKSSRSSSCAPPQACGLELDQVARRLELAKQFRRRNYELEAARREPCIQPFPALTPYSLGAERECLPATDGREYATPCAEPAPGRCGPGRTPPPPRCVELVRDTACRVRRSNHVDACAHVPRTLVQIDRSGQGEAERGPDNTASRGAERTSPQTAGCAPTTLSAKSTPAKNLTTRIMESLSGKPKSSGASCPRRPCGGKCEGSGARRAGDTGWCANMPAPPSVPPPCRKPTPAELLKRRPPSRCGPNSPRCFHSVAPHAKNVEIGKSGSESATSPSQAKADAEKLEKMLQERQKFQEAGRGRFVSGDGHEKKKSSTPAGGSLDIRVPPGTENVQVRVSLGGTSNPCDKKIPKCPEEPTLRCSGVSAAPLEKREPWMSFKSLISSCRKSEDVKMSKKDLPSCPSNAMKKPSSPCGSPAPPSPCKPPAASPSKRPAASPPCKAPAAPSPCKRPAAPPPCKAPPASSPCKPAAAPSPCKQKQSPVSSPCGPPKKTKFTTVETNSLIHEAFLLK